MKSEDIAIEQLNKILKYLGVNPKIFVETPEENITKIVISGDNLNFLIGFRGQSLEALQNLLNIMVFKQTMQPYSVLIDINDYKNKKTEKLLQLTRGFIDKVRFFEKEIEMPPMTPWERKQIHNFVSEYTDVKSESIGEEPNRRIVLKPKKQ